MDLPMEINNTAHMDLPMEINNTAHMDLPMEINNTVHMDLLMEVMVVDIVLEDMDLLAIRPGK
jgi:hypothetical protein